MISLQYIREALPVFVVSLIVAFLWCVFIEIPFAKLAVTLLDLLVQKQFQEKPMRTDKDKQSDNKNKRCLGKLQHFRRQKIDFKDVDANSSKENDCRF